MNSTFNPHKKIQGMTLIELLVALAGLSIVSAIVFNVVVQQSSFRAENLAKMNSENSLFSTVLKLESEFRTALQGTPGAQLLTKRMFNVNRMNPNDPTKYSRVVYEAKCEEIPSNSEILKSLKTGSAVKFTPPIECKEFACPDNQRPVLEITTYPDYTASSAGIKKLDPIYNGTTNSGYSLYEQPIAMSMCVTSPVSSELELIAGYFYAYYANTGKKIAMVKRKFMISRTPPVSGVQYIPN